MASVTENDSDVLIRVVGDIGRITLTRPRARNALTTAMILVMRDALSGWAADPAIRAVAIDGAGGHGLCAGGDVRAMQSSAIAGDGAVFEFFRAEYRLNAQVADYPKPYIALMDGITMGGGIGVSAHGSIRIVTERSVLAMPEVTIGIAPDVGATWLLAQAPGETGTWAALTGSSMTAGDAVYCGLADHYLHSDRIAEFLDRLPETGIEELLTDLAQSPPASGLEAARSWIDPCFGLETAEEIVAALQGRSEEGAQLAASTILEKSPRAVKVALEALRRARRMASLHEDLEQEFTVSCDLMASHDAIEGVRALIVDKDRNPAWVPARLADVDRASVLRAFDDAGHGTLGLA